MPPSHHDEEEEEEEPASSGAPLLTTSHEAAEEETGIMAEYPPSPISPCTAADSFLSPSSFKTKDSDSCPPSPSLRSGSLSPALRQWNPSTSTLSPPRSPRSRKVSFQLFTPVEAAAVRRKMDTHLIPLLFGLYFLAFLDRSNIGNAQVAGLGKDLGLGDGEFTWLLRGFYVTYIAFEWMTLLYKVLPAHGYIAACVAAWGVVASCQALATGFGGLLVCRLLLGTAEAAFGPGVPFYMSFFYRREELAYRVGWFISAAPLASCVAGLLAWGILKVGEEGPVQGWRLLFLVEGFPSVIVAVWCWYWVPDGPGKARWLGKRERRVAVWRLEKEAGEEDGGAKEYYQKTIEGKVEKSGRRGGRGKGGLDWSAIKETLTDPKSYLTAGMFFSCNVAFSSMPVFEPAIVKSMGFTTTAAQGLSALPHFVAFLVVLLVSHLSDKHRSRSPYIMLVASFSMLGYILLAMSPSLGAPLLLKYLCLFPITAGFFSAVTLTIVWTMDNQNSDSAKGTGVALINIIGQMGPMLGTGLYPEDDKPGFVKGHAICAGFMALVIVLSFVLRKVLQARNKADEHVYGLVQELKEYNGDDRESLDHSTETNKRFVYIL
ncbi:MFS-type transporter-like protein 69 [Elsinoe fawcettii]|nr:MFS-type transporter-like protein 69 [Elsinoe fawcettii]